MRADRFRLAAVFFAAGPLFLFWSPPASRKRTAVP